MKPEEIVKVFVKELYRVEKSKFPGFPVDPIHAAAIVVEEAGELQRAALQFTYEKGTSLEMFEEAVHTGAMALRFLLHVEKMEPIKSRQAKRKRAKE